MDDKEIIKELISVLRFYRDGFEPKINKNVRGVTYRPNDALLDDCGQKAMLAVATYSAAGHE